jgi:hypothetical protein
LRHPLKFRQTSLAVRDHVFRRGGGLLPRDLKNHDCVWGNVVHDSPIRLAIHDAQLVTAWADRRHGLGLRQPEPFSALQATQQNPASIRASALNGGVLTSPFNQTSGLSWGSSSPGYVRSDIVASAA